LPRNRKGLLGLIALELFFLGGLWLCDLMCSISSLPSHHPLSWGGKRRSHLVFPNLPLSINDLRILESQPRPTKLGKGLDLRKTLFTGLRGLSGGRAGLEGMGCLHLLFIRMRTRYPLVPSSYYSFSIFFFTSYV